MPIEAVTQQFLNTLTRDLHSEQLSPEQVTKLSTAVAQLPKDARLTQQEIDGIARDLRLPGPHKSALTFALLLHKYGAELGPELKKSQALATGLGGALEALLKRGYDRDPSPVSTALDQFVAGFAGQHANVEASGFDLFPTQAPMVEVKLEGRVSEIRLQAPQGRHFAPMPIGTMYEHAEAGWVLKPHDALPRNEVDLPELGIRTLERLSEGLAAMIAGQGNGRHASPKDAVQIARVTSFAGNLLETVLKTIDDKQKELGAERATSARALRDALRGYQVAHIGREQLNALVGALFQEKKA